MPVDSARGSGRIVVAAPLAIVAALPMMAFAGGVAFERLAFSEELLPGLPADARLAFSDSVHSSPNGEVVVHAWIGRNDHSGAPLSGVYRIVDGVWQPIIRRGEALPGGGVVDDVSWVMLNRRGEATVAVRPSIGGEVDANARVAFTETTDASLVRVLGTGDTVLGEEGVHVDWFHPFSADVAGRTTLTVDLAGPAASQWDEAVVDVVPGGLRSIARLGDAAPGQPGRVFDGFSAQPSVSPSGDALVHAATDGGVRGEPDYGPWISRAEGSEPTLERFIVDAEAVVGVSGTQTLTPDVAWYSGELTRFRASFTDDAGEPAIGVFAETEPGMFELASRDGRSVPALGPGVETASPGFLVSAPGRDRVFDQATLRGPGVTDDNDRAILVERGDTLAPVVREGDAWPGPTGEKSGTFFSPVIISSAPTGDMIILDQDVDTLDLPRFALFGLSRDGDVIRLAVERELFDVDPDPAAEDFRVIDRLWFSDQMLSDAGVATVSMTFTDGTSGIFSSTIPGPSSAVLLAAGAWAGVARRRRAG
jgi:hypothetical protein